MDINKYDIFSLSTQLTKDEDSVIVISSCIANSNSNYVTVTPRIKFLEGAIHPFTIPKSYLDIKLSTLSEDEKIKIDELIIELYQISCSDEA